MEVRIARNGSFGVALEETTATAVGGGFERFRKRRRQLELSGFMRASLR
jgi:hypothetical protein